MNYFYGNEPEMFTFFKIPKLLFGEPYRDMSTDAKLLFGLMLDRMSLSSRSENWIEPDGRVYIYFLVEEVMDTLNIGKNKALNLYKELESHELIQRERQSFGKPAKIYVLKFFKTHGPKDEGFENQTSEVSKSNNGGLENKPHGFGNQTSRGLKNKPHPYETDINETEFTETVSAEPPKAPPAPPNPPIFQIPLNDNSLFDVTADMVDYWRNLYPAVDVEQAFRTMIGWCNSHRNQRKTRRGVEAFINRWLAKEQNQGGTRQGGYGGYQGGGYGNQGGQPWPTERPYNYGDRDNESL